ncbi:hypothetical protein [Synechococcus sp. WH 8016]|uniref:hypothetical protein n=1 Tax=Synechococcus sp. WH 8016 TaxID=166318 RepID=UPI00022D90D4|nr:hypothetical protein [Synechococcus sp. WH 8016]EHA60143.1 hypothetical protein Syn8016DRAFT_2525 [Synechococcus sp. WH 8016]
MSITKASDVRHISKMWSSLRRDAIKDRCSVRVFEGHLYSLIDDDDFYEGSGCRKLINVLLYYWDAIRAFALKDEVEQGLGTSTIARTDEEQLRMDEMSNHFDEWMLTLVSRCCE